MSMKQANTTAVDSAITEAAARQALLGQEMARSSEEALRRMPEMIALCEELTLLRVERDQIIRKTFCR
jgi:hypothetical protein